MKKIVCGIAALVFLGSAVSGWAQAPLPKNDWKVKGGLSGEKSPIIRAGTASKKFKAKEWGEIEIAFSPIDRESKSPFVDGVSVTFIALVEGRGGRTLLKETFNYNSVELNSTNYAVAYVSPSSLARLVGKIDPGASTIRAWGAIVEYKGKEVGYDGKGPKGRWWEAGAVAANSESGRLVPHTKTPFGFINFDRYPDVAD